MVGGQWPTEMSGLPKCVGGDIGLIRTMSTKDILSSHSPFVTGYNWNPAYQCYVKRTRVHHCRAKIGLGLIFQGDGEGRKLHVLFV